MINFNVNKEDGLLIMAITERAVKLLGRGEINVMTMDMDITACHVNGNPLRLQALLDADDSNFVHDVLGIKYHINRKTGKLEDCFLPRYSERQ